MKKQIVKKVLCVLLCAALLLPASLPAAFAADAFTEVNSGDWTYRVYTNGRTMLYRYTGSSENVVVPAQIDGRTITGLFSEGTGAESVMGGNRAVKSITFQLQPASISVRFAKGCPNLTSVTLPDSVTHIQKEAFYGCVNLTTIHWPVALEQIGVRAFQSCMSLTSVDLPDSVTTIHSFAFTLCSNLTTIKLPSALQVLSPSVFKNCTSLTSIDLPASLTTISQLAFAGCKALTSIDVPDTVEEIGAGAFQSCVNLKSAKLPRDLTVISSTLFDGCESLETVNIPGSVNDIQEFAFNGCKKLHDVTLPPRLFNLRDGAFRGCAALTSIALPGTVTNVGAYTFAGCTALKTAVLGYGVRTIGQSDRAEETQATVYDGYTFSGDQLLTVTLPATVNTVYGSSFSGVPVKYFDGTKNQFDSVGFERAEDIQNFRYRVSVGFQSDVGTPPETMHPYLGDTIPLPTMAAQGYAFNGWRNDDTLYTNTYVPTQDAVTLTANWTAAENTIDFVTDKGSTPAPQIVTSGDTLSDPGGQLVGNEYLAGWYKTPDCSGTPYDFSEVVVDSFTLYAKWEPAPLVEVNVTGAGEGDAITFRDPRNDEVFASFTQSGSAYVPGDAQMVVTTAAGVNCTGAIASEVPAGDGTVYLKTQDVVNETRVYTPQYGTYARVDVTFSATPTVTVNAAADGGISTDSLWSLRDGYNNTYTTGSAVTLPSDGVANEKMKLTLTLSVPDGYGCDGTILNGGSTIAVADGMTSVTFLPQGSVTVNLYFYQRSAYTTLTFRDPNGVTGVYYSQKYLRTESTFSAPECPFTSTSGVFARWKQEGTNATLQPGVITPLPQTDTVYIAVWDPARFISFNKNSGTGAMAKLPALETENYTATIPENGFTRDGYAFTGWNTRSNGRGTAYAPGDPVTLTANITLYAQWTSAYTVFLDPNGAAGEAVRQEIARGASAAIPVVPFTRYGGVLTGWNTAADGSGTAYESGGTVTPSANLTLYAQWRADAQALDPYDLLSIDELPNGGRLHAGHTYRLTASYPELGLPADVTWRSLDPSVLTVDEGGNVTAVSNGWASVMAVDATGKAAQVELTVFLNDPAVRIAGDVDMDGAVGAADIVLIVRTLAGGWNVRIWEPQADVNADGVIDLKDVVLIRRYLAEGWNVTLV